jgi:hypothetical protein
MEKKTLLIDDMRDINATRIARTYDEGITALKEGGWDVLYLDHDLGDMAIPERTGYTVLCFLEENPQYLPVRIELVTSNPVGRLKMRSLIEALYRVHRGENG